MKRINYIDVAKGLGIIFIVFGHVMKSGFLRQWFFAFHVPFFILLSGMTYKYKEDKKSFLFNKVKRLLIPYVSFSMISIVIYVIIVRLGLVEGEGRILPNILGMIYGNSNTGYMEWNKPLWFLPCLFMVYIIIDLFETLLRKAEFRHILIMRICFIALMWAVGIILNTLVGKLWLPFHLESAIYLAGFAELGFLVSGYNGSEKINCIHKKSRVKIICLILLCIIAGCIISNFNGSCEIRGHRFGNYSILFLFSTLILSFAFILLSVEIENCSFLQKVGKSSLSILLMHKFAVIVFQNIPILKNWLSGGNSFLGITSGVCVTLIVTLLCMIGENIIERFAPVILGKVKERRRKEIE